MNYNICEKIVRQNFLEYTDPYTLNKHSMNMTNSKIEIEINHLKDINMNMDIAYSLGDMNLKKFQNQ
jgi:hypothetical protein